MEREDMLEATREAAKESDLFRQICLAFLDEKKLAQVGLTWSLSCLQDPHSTAQLVDKCQYDEVSSEWIVPYVRPSRDVEFRLPDIESAAPREDSVRHSFPKSGTHPSTRPNSGQPPSVDSKPKRPTSRSSKDLESAPKEKSSDAIRESRIPVLPSHAPSKPPMPRSARRDKKKSKSSPPVDYSMVTSH
jgi:hypothetical protein